MTGSPSPRRHRRNVSIWRFVLIRTIDTVPFTEAGQQPVVPGVTTRHDIAVLANLTGIPAGGRLQLMTPSTVDWGPSA